MDRHLRGVLGLVRDVHTGTAEPAAGIAATGVGYAIVYRDADELEKIVSVSDPVPAT